MLNNSKLLLIIALLGVACVCIGLYSVFSKEQSPSSSTPMSRPVFQSKMTTPQGPILGDGSTGLYYRNYNNSLDVGVAYKFARDQTVYIFDGQKLRRVVSPGAYTRFYGCSANVRVIDCAPVYEMPSSVTNDMLNGELIR